MNPLGLSQNHNPTNQLTLPPTYIHTATPQLEPHIKIQPITSSHPQPISSSETPQFFTTQINKLIEANTIIRAQLSLALEEKKIILQLIENAQKKQDNQSLDFKEKRYRRSAKDIERKFRCEMKGCGKSYGTEGSLFQHIRLKHPQTNTHDPPLNLPLNPDPC